MTGYNLDRLAALITPPGDWVRRAACQYAEPETWWPEKGGSAAPAKAICATCPVVDPCLEYALANDEPDGVWGGLSRQERRQLQRWGRVA